MEQRHYGELLESIYEAALDPAALGGIIAPFTRFLDVPSCVFQFRGARFDDVLLFASTPNVDAAAQAAYAAHYARLDPWGIGWQRIRRPGIYHGAELTDQRALPETEYYRDFARSHGTFHFVTGCVQNPGATAFLAAHRPMGAEDFGAAELRRLHLLLPHLQRAIHISSMLANADLRSRAALDALDRLALGLLIVRDDGAVAFANPAAERILRDGAALTVHAGRLRAHAPNLHAALLEMLRRAALLARGQAADPADVLLLPRGGRPPLSVLVAPLAVPRPFLAFAAGTAIVFVHDPETARRPRLGVLATLFGLTRAESRLLAALLQGERLADYADGAGISLQTAKVQLRSIFAKTGIDRQAELVRVATANLVAALSRPERPSGG